MQLLTVKHLHAFYGKTEVLYDINFTLDQGEFALILGPNGAGKTTILRALSGMVKTKGEITLGGNRINNMKTAEIARLNIAHVPESQGVFKELTVSENLHLGTIFCTPANRMIASLTDIFDWFPVLKKKFKHIAGLLSGGEQQMLAIARAFLMQPQLLLLDEPSAGLAPYVVQYLFNLLQRINQEQQITILLVEQNVHLALPCSHYVYVLESGRIIASGKPHDIQNQDIIRKVYLGV